ncbi:hypothetical protein [Bordetella hinzii]|uniref:hypothetical protein n=1 Tax=Bordetella hinzii TaxID=103855 RepID=UPI00114D7D83|nr:hypothetical protein [Bordetella hinzii]
MRFQVEGGRGKHWPGASALADAVQAEARRKGSAYDNCSAPPGSRRKTRAKPKSKKTKGPQLLAGLGIPWWRIPDGTPKSLISFINQ